MSDEQSTTWTLLFEPLGVLVFRDDRPFDAGRHALAVSRFPLPSVFRGAVRAALFEAAGADFRRPGFGLGGEDAILGNGQQREGFTLRGPLVVRDVGGNPGYEYVLPWPRDAVVTGRRDGENGESILQAEIMRARHAHDPEPTCLRMGAPDEAGKRSLEPLRTALPWTEASRLPKPQGKPWLTVAGAQQYVQRSSQPESAPLELVEGQDWLEQDSFLCEEKRVGIARATESGEERLVAAESMLYTLIAWRMCPSFRFAVEIDVGEASGVGLHARLAALIRQLDGRLVRLGGKSGHARVTVVEDALAPRWAQPLASQAPSSSKLWLWTPGLYDPGTAPGAIATMGEAIRLGGFDMAKHQPRPLLGALDRGSVLWFSALDHEALARHREERAKEQDLPAASYGYGQWIPRSNA